MFPNILSQRKTASALELLGFAADGGDSVMTRAMLTAGLGGGLQSSIVGPGSLPLQFFTPTRILGPDVGPTSVSSNSDIFAELVGREALRKSLLGHSPTFRDPRDAFSAPVPTLFSGANFVHQKVLNEAFQRGQDEALLSLLRSGVLGAPLLQGPPVMPPARLTEQSNVTVTPPVDTKAVALEALGTVGGERRKKNAPYFDASSLEDPDPLALTTRRTRGGVTEPFPEKLYRMLRETEEAGESDLISFFPHGRAFAIHHVERFCREVMPRYFKQSRLSSFQRQLNLYGFTRITSGPDTGGYYHELFLKGRPALVIHMRRVGVPKPTRIIRTNKPAVPAATPDFYSMAPVKNVEEECESKPAARK